VLLQKVFGAFAGKFLGATAVGVTLGILAWKNAGVPNDEVLTWCVTGGVMGSSAALLLTSPKLVFGVMLLLVGLFLTVAPLTVVDGGPVIQLVAQCMKYGIGFAFLFLGGWLVVSGLRRRANSRVHKASPDIQSTS
jgi:hypothetical protein